MTCLIVQISALSLFGESVLERLADFYLPALGFHVANYQTPAMYLEGSSIFSRH